MSSEVPPALGRDGAWEWEVGMEPEVPPVVFRCEVSRVAKSCHRGAAGAAGAMATGFTATGGGTELGAGSGRALMSDKRRNMWWSRFGAPAWLHRSRRSQIDERATNDVKLRHNI